MLRTTIAGSLPKPSWLADPSYLLFAPWVVPPDRLPEAQDYAVRLALLEQDVAGIYIVTDGEQRRRHYIWGFHNAEARDLADVGADVIQLDDPCFNIYLDKMARWGVEALERALDAVPCTTAVHICYSYGIPRVLERKARNTDWGQYRATLPLLRRTRVKQISVECAASRVDVSALAEAGDKDVLLGVIDVGTETVETPELVAARIRAALPYVPPDRLYPCTDCGLVPRSRAAARGKLRALAAGAALVRRELLTARAGGR